MKDNKKIAVEVLEKVGGKENIINCFHCVTRLRFELKDKSLINKTEIESIEGVIALKIQGDQYQVVIGQNVGEVYAELCKVAGFQMKEAVEENLDVKEPLTLKGIGNKIIQAIVNSIIPTLPILIGAGMFKVIAMLLLYFGVVEATNSTYLVFKEVGESGFYFLPIFVGMSAAKHFKTSVPLATMICAFLVSPAFIAGMSGKTMSHVFGIPISVTAYKQTVLPAILIVWALSYVYKFWKRIIPKIISTVFVPTMTLVIMIPIAICVLGPLGAILGNYMAAFLMWIYNTFGWFGVGVMGALRPLLIFTGMHTALIPFAITSLTELGYESFFGVTGMGYVFASAAACLAVGLKSKNLNTKSSAIACASTAFIGGITEPSLYGVLMKFRKPLIAVMIANFASGAYFGITHTYIYEMPGSTGVFGIPVLIGPTGANLINGLIALAISMILAFILTWVFGFEDTMEESGLERKVPNVNI